MVITNKEEHSENIKLSIQVSLNGLSFCALQQEQKRILYFRDIRFERKLNPIEVLQKIENLYQKEEFLKRTSAEVVVLFSNDLYCVVPEKLFKEDNASDYLKFNTKILETDFVAQDYLAEGLVNVYIPYTNINNFFFDRHGEFEYRHSTSVLIEEFLKLDPKDKEGTTVYLNSHDAGYDLVIIRNGQLIFANSFICETREDFIYYLLFTAEQLDLDPTTFDLILTGDIKEDSERYQIAYTYVKNVNFLETSFGYIFEGDKAPPRGYQYFTLLKSV